MPTSPSDWHPIEPKQPESIPVQRQEIPVETHKIFCTAGCASSTTCICSACRANLSAQTRTRQKEENLDCLRANHNLKRSNVVVALNQAKGELDRGDIPAALAHYGKLIKKGKHLEETIRDLTESIYRYPVEVGIWQTLGDAYMRANRLKEALEAYNKAEELIR